MDWIKTRPNNRFCIVSIQIGEHHRNWWKLCFRQSWMAYARRHGYDLLILDEPWGEGGVATVPEIKFQKFRLLEWEAVQAYEKVVYLDADILLTESAPCIGSRVARGKVGAVSQVHIPFRDWHDQVQPRRGADPAIAAYYRTHLNADEQAIAEGVDDILNGGLLVFEPKTHRDLLAELHQRYLPGAEGKTGHIDQPILSCELLRRGLADRLDVRFNAIYSMWYALHYDFIPETDETLMRAMTERLVSLVFGLHFPSMRGVKFLPQRFFDADFVAAMQKG